MAWSSLNVYTRYKAFASGSSLTPADMNAIQDEYGQKFTPQAWQSLAISFFTTSLVYMKDSLGFVHFRGDVMTTTNPAAAIGQTIGTLPAGYRPGATISISVSPITGTIPKPVTITTAGVMTCGQTMSDASNMSWNATFLAEN